ncbi:MAG TPA: hypothetical protein VH722_02115 [Alphaproteobacteria bacterium]|jgi:hypothetical protein|nr:hypothetical protein [Alphaproteobacteria bacterium]
MTYSVDLFFKPGIGLERIARYFAARGRFSVSGREAAYRNEDTQVGFFFKFRHGRSLLLRRTVASAEFEVNYNRPSWFGDEAEIELSAFVAAFRPRIDPQMRGMNRGPYSGAGFLRGWDFGNTFSIRTMLFERPDFRMATLPRERLRSIWAWNYARAAEHAATGDRRFTPLIQFFSIDGRVCTVAVWSQGMPVLLPKVDYVLVGRLAGNDRRFGLEPWSEVLDVVAQNPRFDLGNDPLALEYFQTPPAIAKWVNSVKAVDLQTLERLSPLQVYDAELAAAARKSIAIGEINGAITLEPPPR